MTRFLVALLAFVLLGLSAATAFFEARPQMAQAKDLDEQIVAFAAIQPGSRPVSVFESSIARGARIGSCIDAIHTVAITEWSVPRPLLEGCLAVAEATVARAPLSSNDWFLAATIATRLGNEEKTRRYLERSFRTGPNEQWIAGRRALFAYDLRDKLDPDLRDLLDRDLLLLLRTNQGVETLARRFVSDPGLRGYLVGLAETTEPTYQKRFLDSVRSAIQARGG